MPAAQAPQYLPLNIPTSYERKYAREGGIDFSSGGVSNPFRIDQTMLLTGILLTFHGTVSVPAGNPAPILSAKAPYALFKKVNLSAGGPGRICSIGGYALGIFERMRESDFTGSFDFAPAAGGGGAVVTPVSFDLHVPVAARDGDTYGQWSDLIGAIYTGDPSVQVSLQIEWGTESDVFSNQSASLATITGTCDIVPIKRDVPMPSADVNLLRVISWSHQLILEQSDVPIVGAGSLAALATLPSAQPRVYLRVLDIIQNNGIPVNGLLGTRKSTVQDTFDYELDLPEQSLLAFQKRRYTVPLPAGSYAFDRSSSNLRDAWLSVGAISLFRISPTIVVPAGVTLVNATLNRYSEVLVPSSLAAKWLGLASAAGVNLTGLAA